MISSRPKAALAAAKARGVKLGNPRLEEAREPMLAARKEAADVFAREVAPIIAKTQRAGATTLRGIGAALDARGVRTPQGRSWSAMMVKNVLAPRRFDEIANLLNLRQRDGPKRGVSGPSAQMSAMSMWVTRPHERRKRCRVNQGEGGGVARHPLSRSPVDATLDSLGRRSRTKFTRSKLRSRMVGPGAFLP